MQQLQRPRDDRLRRLLQQPQNQSINSNAKQKENKINQNRAPDSVLKAKAASAVHNATRQRSDTESQINCGYAYWSSALNNNTLPSRFLTLLKQFRIFHRLDRVDRRCRS